MKYLVISDVHSNWEALEAFLNFKEKLQYDSIIFLGDAVGYGANPNECIAILKDISQFAVLGNHDSAVINPKEMEYFNPYAREAVDWTRNILDEESMLYLRGLPLTIKLDNLLLVHASPFKPERWIYILNEWEAEIQFQHVEEWIVLFGHSHIPGAFVKDGENIYFTREEVLALDEEKRYLINPGSIGQPRDMDPRASFGILDMDRREFRWFRVPYDVRKAQEKIVKAGLPPFLAERLERGL